MSLTVITRPQAWSFAQAPIVYTMQRKDASFNSITNNGGNARLVFTGVDLTPSGTNFVRAGDSIYIKTTATPALDGFFTIATVAFSGGDTWVNLTAAYPGVTDTGYINNFTSRPGYRVDVEIWDDVATTKIFSDALAYTPSKTGLLKIDVQSIYDAMLPTITAVGIAEVNSGTDLAKARCFYIKYTEVWIGSANVQTSDAANTFYAVFGKARALMATNNVTLRSDSYWLDQTVRPTLFDGRYMAISYFNVPVGKCVVCERYQYGALVKRTVSTIAPTGMSRLRLMRTALLEDTIKVWFADVSQSIKQVNTNWTDSVGVTVKTINTFTITGAPAQSTATQQTTVVPANTKIYIRAIHERNVWVGNATFTWRLLDAGLSVIASQSFVYAASGIVTETVELATAGVAAAYIEVAMVSTGAGSGASFMKTTVPVGDPIVDGAAISTVKTVDVVDAVENQITLGWTNEIGGDQFYTFVFNQSYGYTYRDGTKVTRVTMYAERITIDEFEAIAMANAGGTAYELAAGEIDGTRLGDMRRPGQQVYAVRPDGTFIEVVVVSSDAMTLTRQALHRVELTIELPAGFTAKELY